MVMMLFEGIERKCQCGQLNCDLTLEGYPTKMIVRPEHRAWYNRKLARIRNQRNGQSRKVDLEKKAYRFLDGDGTAKYLPNYKFQEAMKYRINSEILAGRTKINIAWICWDIRQKTNLKFKNAHIPYFKIWICENWPKYRRYFVEDTSCQKS